MLSRDYYRKIWREFDTEKSLVLISGPRQSGKTTLAKKIASMETSSLYFNYDIPANKARLLTTPTFFEDVDRKKGARPLIVLDEIHKYPHWKDYLKGTYDGYADKYRFLVTGSGRLELLRSKGDSLAGRFLQFHLFPLTIGEMFATGKGFSDDQLLLEFPETNPETQSAWDTMMNVSGFPEPFLKNSVTSYRRWANTYHSQVIRNDIRDEFAVKQIDLMESLYALLPKYIGSPFSASGVARTLKVSHKTITSWMEVFERFYLIFKLRPFSRNIPRAVQKEPKYYFYDYCKIRDPAIRFENMIAVELNRAVTLWKDYGLGDYKLSYLRNKEKQEVDFVITCNDTPKYMIEAKLSDTSVSPNLIKFQNLLNIPAIQLINKPGTARLKKNASNQILVINAADWLPIL